MLNQIKTNLLDQKAQLQARTYHEDIDVDGDETDEIQGKILMHVASQLSSRDQAKLLQIDRTLAKIANKTFGVCEECEEEIGEKRLLANPVVLTCIGCAENQERKAKQYRRN